MTVLDQTQTDASETARFDAAELLLKTQSTGLLRCVHMWLQTFRQVVILRSVNHYPCSPSDMA